MQFQEETKNTVKYNVILTLRVLAKDVLRCLHKHSASSEIIYISVEIQKPTSKIFAGSRTLS